MRETTFRRGAPLLEPPHRVLQRLARELLAVGGEVREHVYLNAANAKHRWAMRHFGNVDEEFRFKVVWVARLLRDTLGSPSHPAFVALPSRMAAHRAAAWRLGEAIGFVSLYALRGRRRPRLRVVLGAIRLMANAHVIASITPDLPYLSAEAEVPYDARGGQSGNA
jgi:hypothetical protein